jgi:hypothetical protein
MTFPSNTFLEIIKLILGRKYQVLPPSKKNDVSGQLQEFAKFYVANLVFCQLVKAYAK